MEAIQGTSYLDENKTKSVILTLDRESSQVTALVTTVHRPDFKVAFFDHPSSILRPSFVDPSLKDEGSTKDQRKINDRSPKQSRRRGWEDT